MDTNEYTTVGFRLRSTDCTFNKHDVRVFLFNQVHHRTAHNINESEISNSNGYKHKINRSTKTNATRFKGIGIECSDPGELYN